MKPIIFLAFANDKVDNTRYLRNLPLELDGIRKALQPAVREGLCEVIERANVSIEQIFDVFQTYKDRIAIFHYGGHADGYQLLLETLSMVADLDKRFDKDLNDWQGFQPLTALNKIAHGEGLVSFFARQRGLQLVFFNGCSTQQQALELVQAGIPAVIGTSNSINDDIATTLSIRFYLGLAKGASLEKAWLEATDEVKVKEGTANLRGLYRKSQTEIADDRFPWEIHFRTGAEKVKEWNLPEEVDNPLFGLPQIPQTFSLPESPFLFLKRYERPHAEVFFGRSYYVRELYNKITDAQAPPIILLYGQSGTGKSSLFDAGLNPRLEHSHLVIYLRRDQNKGLVGTLKNAIAAHIEKLSSVGTQTRAEDNMSSVGTQTRAAVSKRKESLENLIKQLHILGNDENLNLSEIIESLEEKLLPPEIPLEFEIKNFDEQKFLAQFGDVPYADLLKSWRKLESIVQKPLVVILDQAEELFTRPIKHLPNELVDLAKCLQAIFNNPTFAPQGKLILGYRKEYQAEFEERFKECAIPRSKIFLEPLSRKDIIDIFNGLTETPHLKQRYNLEIDKNLPVIIADDLLEDKDSPVAPILQILLTKMWDKVRESPNPIFTVALYQNLKREGFLLDDFFRQQSKKLAEWNEDLEESGLPLDILQFHTTNLGTAGSKSWEEIKERYAHIPEKAELLLYKLKELYLLVEAGQNRTNLTHDTLAPLVKNESRKSERVGQRVSRMLENQLNDFLLNPQHVLDELEVNIVEKGKEGMRVWTADEQKFVQASQAARIEKEKARKRRRQYAIAALSTILVTALFSLYQWNKSTKNADSAKMKELMLLSSQKVSAETDTVRDLAVRLAEQAAYFAEHTENKDKGEIFDNFRKVSEAYRIAQAEEGKQWLPPYQEIRYRESPFPAKFSQQKMNDPAFLRFRRNSAEFGESGENMPDFPADSTEYPSTYLKNTLDNENLVVWIQFHSFRIYPYRRSKATKIIRADSSIVDFFPVDSTTWFVRDIADSLKILNPQTQEIKAFFNFLKDSTASPKKLQFIKYKSQQLYLWYDRYMLRFGRSQADSWEQPLVDTLFSLPTDKFPTQQSSSDLRSTYMPADIEVNFSADMHKGIVYSGKQAAIYVYRNNENSAYKILPIVGWGMNNASYWESTNAFYCAISPSISHLLTNNGQKNFSLYALKVRQDKVVLEEVFNKTIATNQNAISKVSITKDDSNHLLIRLSDQVRVYDFEGNMKDILYSNQNQATSLSFDFSDDGKYIINLKKDRIFIYLPLYDIHNWLVRAEVPEMTISKKSDYGVATLAELWQVHDSRKLILAQFVSFATILLIFIRYTPIAIHLYKEKRHYKIVMYGFASFVFIISAIYREAFTEIEGNIINQLADNFTILSLFYICVILFEQRQEIREIIKEKKWRSLVLYTAPELIVLSVAMYGTYQIYIHQTDTQLYLFSLSSFYLLNVVVLWTLHLSETSFKEKKYVKTFGLLFFAYNYLSWFLTQYANSDNEWLFYVIALGYFLLWFVLWIGKGIYDWWKKKLPTKKPLFSKE